MTAPTEFDLPGKQETMLEAEVQIELATSFLSTAYLSNETASHRLRKISFQTPFQMNEHYSHSSDVKLPEPAYR